jgi:hypothetical protein
MNKLTFEEWKKEHGSESVENHPEYNKSFIPTPESVELTAKLDKERYDLYCKKIDALNTDPHSDKTYAEGMSEFMTEIGTLINKWEKEEKEKRVEDISMIMRKLNNIEEKNRCLRVRMYDWLSDLFADWSKRCHERSVKIDSPCAIRLPESGKENSRLTDPMSWVTPKVTVEEYDNMNSKRIKRR